MYDIITGCENSKVDGLILLVDFEKAFDSISWHFIKPSRSCDVGIHWIALTEYSQMSTHVLGF